MRRAPIIAIAAVLAAATAAAASRLSAEHQRPYDVAVVPRATVLRWLSLGHPTLVANAFYLRAVQYIGEPRANERGWEKLHPLVDLVTDLDPGHGYAYQVAGIILGSVGRVQESNAILEKGTRAFPGRYILPYLRAFNAFYYEDDFALAGKFAEIAASKEGAPAHVRQTMLAYYVKGQRPEAAIAYLSGLLAEARDDESREALAGQLKQAYLERDAAVIEVAVERFRREQGRDPERLEELVAAGLIRAIPRDPFGGSYYLDNGGRVRSTEHAFRYHRPRDLDKRQEPGVTPERGYPGVAIP